MTRDIEDKNSSEFDEDEKLISACVENQQVSNTRRKLVIGAAPIMASLISRPVWAGGSEFGRCTISGAMSGPSSTKEDELCQGLTPGYWKNATQHPWPFPYSAGTCADVNGGGNCDGWAGDGTKFSATFPQCAISLAGIYGGFDWLNADLMAVLQEDKGGSVEGTLQFAFHAVAALLNSADPDVNYGYTAGQFINLVEHYCQTGIVLGLGALSLEQFKNLLDTRNNGGFSII